MAVPQFLSQPAAAEARWTVAQGLALALFPCLLAGLIAAPEVTLTVLWYTLIPVLPATFFLNPGLWRGLCPLASLNRWGNRLGTPRLARAGEMAVFGAIGLILFHLLVPARRFLFNTHGPALALTIVAVGLLAVVLGARYAVRSAFCNGLCPVLPIEQLYGQSPLLPISRGRCATCTTCTPRGCIDLAGSRALAQLFGPSRRDRSWLRTPHGLFFAALPGFIIGYSLVSDGKLATAGEVYLRTAGWSFASLLMVGLLVGLVRVPSARALPALAALAGGLYYWFAGPAVAAAFGAGGLLGAAIRAAGIGLAVVWLVRAVRPRSGGGRSGKFQAVVVGSSASPVHLR